MPDDVTPVRQQYLEIKRQYPDAILFFRLGDFYETFDQDAETTARELDIVLTSRPIGNGMRAPLAGIPYHAVENYLSRLINKGYHVAICEQIGDQPTKGIFPRRVVRVITPGTIVEPNLLPGDANNYLVSVVTEDGKSGIAYVDISTGEFAATEITGSDHPIDGGAETWAELKAELTRLHPSEIIHPENIILPASLSGQETAWSSWRFEFGKCQEALLSHFKASTLDGFGLRNMPLAVRAAGGIIQYITETGGDTLPLLENLRVYTLSEFMSLDASTRRNLELVESLQGDSQSSLLGTIDKTVTPMGKRLIRKWVNQPLLDVPRIRIRQSNIEYFFASSMLRSELRLLLKGIIDLERLVNRITSNHAQPRDLVALRETLTVLPSIDQLLNKHQRDGSDNPLPQNFPAIHRFMEELDLLNRGITDDPPSTLQNTGVIRPSYSPELDGVIEASRHARDWINNLEVSERQRTGIKTLRVGYNKVFGYYIEISKGQAANAPSEYIRKQTLVNSERFITPEMKEYETLVLNAEERIREIEVRLFHEVCTILAKSAAELLRTSNALSELDVYSSLADCAAMSGYVKPEVVEENILEVHDGRHPVVEKHLKEGRYVPNDVIFEKGEIIRVITGPNMSGKSTYLRQTALIVLLAQMGAFVPAASARIGLVDRIFTRIGAQDEIHAGQSTFMVEMIETANILHHATNRSLLILDEIGRGTSTYDGVSIAWSVIEYIHNHPLLRAKTIFATHYHELMQLSELLPGVRNYNVAVTEIEDQVVFLHKIIPGGADKSYGIHVAQLAGLPRPVIQRAAEIMTELEKSSGQAVHINPQAAKQVALFPETNPLLDQLRKIDINGLSPIEALNLLFEWQRHYIDHQNEEKKK